MHISDSPSLQPSLPGPYRSMEGSDDTADHVASNGRFGSGACLIEWGSLARRACPCYEKRKSGFEGLASVGGMCRVEEGAWGRGLDGKG